MRRATVLLAILVTACNQAAQPAAKTVATSSPSSAASPSSGSCLLPILTPDGLGAYISFPSGAVSFDPQAHGLQWNGGAYYDRAFSRWLPAPRQAVSPDGRHYAYLEFKVPGTPQPARLHVVDVSTGKDQLYELGSPSNGSAYVVVDFAQEGIWLSYAGYESPGGGLLLFDLATGVLKSSDVPGITDPVAAGPGAFWFTDPGPNPQASAIGFPIPARVLRLTISDSKTVIWLTKPGVYIKVLGADVTGHPIISAWENQGNGNDIWLVSSPTSANLVGLPQGDYQLIADGHGVWFGSQHGIYLYSDNGRLLKVSNQPGYPANGCS